MLKNDVESSVVKRNRRLLNKRIKIYVSYAYATLYSHIFTVARAMGVDSRIGGLGQTRVREVRLREQSRVLVPRALVSPKSLILSLTRYQAVRFMYIRRLNEELMMSIRVGLAMHALI